MDIYGWFIHQQWWFSIVMLVCQRVTERSPVLSSFCRGISPWPWRCIWLTRGHPPAVAVARAVARTRRKWSQGPKLRESLQHFGMGQNDETPPSFSRLDGWILEMINRSSGSPSFGQDQCGAPQFPRFRPPFSTWRPRMERRNSEAKAWCPVDPQKLETLGEMVSWVNFWGFIFLSGPAGHVGHVGSTAPAASCQHGLSEVGGLSELVLWRPPRRGANLPSKHGDINKKTGMVGLLGES